jgi:predicted site-specific integrase-resolvase
MQSNIYPPKFDYNDSKTWPLLLPLNLVSKLLNLNPWTLRRWDKKGKLIAIRMGDRGDRKYRKTDIMRILKKGTKKVEKI